MSNVIDEQGYRANVGIIICNATGQVMLAKRIGHDAWQFPQGGIDANEELEQAMFRELQEETGLLPSHVDILGQTQQWLYYDLPERFQRPERKPFCIGQKQKWFLLKLTANEEHIDLSANSTPEFDRYEWVSYWYPLDQVIDFKRQVYQQAMLELRQYL